MALETMIGQLWMSTPNSNQKATPLANATNQARIQSTAATLGKVTFLSAAEAAAIEETGDLQVERTWEYWKMEAHGHA